MKEALAVVSLGYETEDKQRATVITKSHSVPKLQVNGWGNSSVTLDSDSITVALTGRVDDKSAGLVQQPSLNTIYVIHNGQQVGAIPLQRVGDSTSKFAPYACHFTFSGNVQVPKTSGAHNLELVTNLNDLGENARAETGFTVKAELPQNDGSGSGSGYIAMPFQFPSTFSDSQPETITLVLPNLDPQQPPTSVSLAETGNNTLVFQSTDGLTSLTLDVVPDLDPAQVDVTFGMVVLGGVSFEDVSLIEGAIDSRLFVADLPATTIGGTMPAPTWSMGAVNAMRVAGGDEGWGWQPYLIKLAGPSQIIGTMVSENRVYHNGRRMQMKNDGDAYYATGFADSGSGGGGVAGNEGSSDQPMPFLESQATPQIATSLAKYDSQGRMTSTDPSDSRWWVGGGGYKAYKGHVGAVDVHVWVDTALFGNVPQTIPVTVLRFSAGAQSGGFSLLKVQIDGKETSLPVQVNPNGGYANRTSSPSGHFDAIVFTYGAEIPASASGNLNVIENAEAATLAEYTKVQWPANSKDWVWTDNAADGVYAEPGWVWNPEDLSYLIKDRMPLWTLPQGLGSIKTLPDTLKEYFGVTDADLDPASTDEVKIKKRAVFNAFLIEIQRGSINHWGLAKVEGGKPVGRAVFDWFVNDIIKTYTQVDEATDRSKPADQRIGIKAGQIKREFLRWPGYFNLHDLLGKFSANQEVTGEKSTRYWHLIGNWYIDTDKRLVDGVATVLAAASHIADPFTYLSYLSGGGDTLQLPAEGTATWCGVLVDGALLVADRFLPGAGKGIKSAKMTFKWGEPAGVKASVKAGLTELGDVTHDAANMVIAAAKGGMCFVAGTKVKTGDGWKDIENVAVGDRVWSRDEATGQEGIRPVAEVFITHPSALVHLKYTRAGHQRGGDHAGDPDGDAASEIVGTPVHPFWVVERRTFVPMGQLQVGYHLALAGGQLAVVTETETQGIPDGHAVTTYNFSVQGWNTYFAAGGGSGQGFVWVHNLGELCDKAINKAKDIWTRKGKRMFEVQPFKNFTPSQKYVTVNGNRRLNRPALPNEMFSRVDPRVPGDDEWIDKPFDYIFSAKKKNLEGKVVRIKENGHPDFGDFVYKVNGQRTSVTVQISRIAPSILNSGNAAAIKRAKSIAREDDFKNARKAFKAQYGVDAPANHTWHHTEDVLNGQGKLELVLTDAHAPFSHHGGRSIVDVLDAAGVPW